MLRSWMSPSRLRRLEVDGYVRIEGAVDEDTRRAVLAALDDAVQRSSAKPGQVFAHDLQLGPYSEAVAMAAHGPALAFLRELFGDEPRCVGVSFSGSDVGYPGMDLHTDAHPYGSSRLGWRGTSPILLRVLYYLDGTAPDRAPLRVVPSSHLSLGSDAMPYRRFARSADEELVCCAPGDAVVINQRLFHGAGPHARGPRRTLLAVSYRPLWAGPTEAPPQGDAGPDLAHVPAVVARLFASPGQRVAEDELAGWEALAGPGEARSGRSRWSERED